MFKFSALIDGNETTFLKIGMTTRCAEERLREVTAELKKHGNVHNADVLAYAKYAGRVEPLLHYFHAKNRYKLASFKELFNSSIEYELREQFESLNEKEPLKPFKLKINLLCKPPSLNKDTGRRPKSREELIKEYPEVVELLKENLSIRDVARQTGRAKNTVQKVKSAMLY